LTAGKKEIVRVSSLKRGQNSRIEMTRRRDTEKREEGRGIEERRGTPERSGSPP